MGADEDRFVMLKESEIQIIIDELGRIPHDLFTFMNYDKIIEKLKWKEPPMAELLTKEGEPEKCENCGKIITPEMKEGQDVIYAGAEHTMSSEVGEMIPYRDEMFAGAYCCQDCYEEQSGIKRAFKKGYEKGYNTALDIINNNSIPVMDDEAMNKFVEENSESSVYRIVNYDNLLKELSKLQGDGKQEVSHPTRNARGEKE